MSDREFHKTHYAYLLGGITLFSGEMRCMIEKPTKSCLHICLARMKYMESILQDLAEQSDVEIDEDTVWDLFEKMESVLDLPAGKPSRRISKHD